ncbi:HD domain-containing protein [Patescibacteria group bacterium]|nr:HD domain-containing protein [Patescibacteria group bacterium]
MEITNPRLSPIQSGRGQIQKIEKFIESKLDSLNWQHTLEVRNIALKLARLEKADKDIVEAAALFHDIGKIKGDDNHTPRSEEIARKYLESESFNQNFIEEVVYCIAVHEYHWIGKANLIKTIEAQVLADADTIQKLSPWGIIKHSIKYQEDFNKSYEEGIKKLWEKLMKCYNLILTKSGQKEAEKGYKFVKDFFKDLL